ncbi:MAG: hypothetical protein VX313_02590 [Bacteroidota bacterium]|nr:hypothetical protein [Bacteroidota bacterium]MEE3020117.1 hypothetical protein [Bacteroidota bacterium]
MRHRTKKAHAWDANPLQQNAAELSLCKPQPHGLQVFCGLSICCANRNFDIFNKRA